MKPLVVKVAIFMKWSRGVTERLLQAVGPVDSFKGEREGMTREGRDSESTGRSLGSVKKRLLVL